MRTYCPSVYKERRHSYISSESKHLETKTVIENLSSIPKVKELIDSKNEHYINIMLFDFDKHADVCILHKR